MHQLSSKACFRLSSQFKALCRPFMEQNGLYHYAYIRDYANGSVFALTSHPEMSIDFITHEFIHDLDFIHKLRQSQGQHYFLLNDMEQPEKCVIAHGRHHYQIGDGVTTVNNTPTYQEQFYVAFKAGEYNTVNRLNALLPHLKSYLIELKDIGRSLIQTSQKDTIHIPRFKLGSVSSQDVQIIQPSSSIKRYHITDSIWLTKREYQCVQAWLSGWSCHDISKIHGLSVKTIESYVQQAKDKLEATNKNDLMVKFSKHFVLS